MAIYKPMLKRVPYLFRKAIMGNLAALGITEQQGIGIFNIATALDWVAYVEAVEGVADGHYKVACEMEESGHPPVRICLAVKFSAIAEVLGGGRTVSAWQNPRSETMPRYRMIYRNEDPSKTSIAYRVNDGHWLVCSWNGLAESHAAMGINIVTCKRDFTIIPTPILEGPVDYSTLVGP